MDASFAADGDGGVALGLEWQEALPVVKRLRLQLRRLQQKGQQQKLDGGPQQPASSSAPTAPSPPAEAPAPTSSQLAAAPATLPLLC